MKDAELQRLSELVQERTRQGDRPSGLLAVLRERRLGRVDAMTVLRRAYGIEISAMQSVMWWQGWGTADATLSDSDVDLELGPLLARKESPT